MRAQVDDDSSANPFNVVAKHEMPTGAGPVAADEPVAQEERAIVERLDEPSADRTSSSRPMPEWNSMLPRLLKWIAQCF